MQKNFNVKTCLIVFLHLFYLQLDIYFIYILLKKFAFIKKKIIILADCFKNCCIFALSIIAESLKGGRWYR